MDPHDQPSDLERLTALKALREYVYLQRPVQYGMADFVEDIPAARPYGMFMQDAIPSATVIKRDPHERHEQIQKAVHSIERLHGNKSDLGNQTLRSAGAGAIGSVPLSLLFGGATRLLGRGKGPILSGLGEDVAHGVAWGGTLGAAAPVATHALHPSHKALHEAADILQKSPYTTGLPGGDIVNSINYKKKDESKSYQMAKSTGVGAGLGAAAGGLGGLASSGAGVLSSAVQRKIFGSTTSRVPFSPRQGIKPGLVGAGLGAGLGLLESALQ
jgi:hypothetical protein